MRALSASAVRDVVISPGSRSTPLALAAAEEGALRCHTAVDERTAAFFALGQARVTGRPTALVCTSGTAGAHYLPAILEASQSYVPLLVITADRPWELADVAAPQTLDQLKLFGDAVRHFAELGLPDSSPLAMRAVQRIAAQAAARSLGPVPGPVHINARFRKPLEPVSASTPEFWLPLWEEMVRSGPTRVFEPSLAPRPEALDEIAARVGQSSKGIVVCGPAPIDPEGRLGRALEAFSRRTGFVVLAEATSQVRYGAWTSSTPFCAAFDVLFRVPTFRATHAPDLILELGAPPTSGTYAELCASSPRIPRYVIAPHGWNDPAGTATALVHADPAAAIEGITQRLSEQTEPSRSWTSSFARADAEAKRLAAKLRAERALTEGAVSATVVASCPAGSVLMIGNSMPVRDVDTWVGTRVASLDVLHQRGASGIDGLVSGAAGALAAAERPVTLLLGDLSLLHDLGGLALARRARHPLVIVVVQNDGGRIFETLPVVRATERERFDKCFTMSEPVDLAAAASAFGVRFARATTREELGAALEEAWQRPGATLVEAIVPPGDGAARLSRLRAELASALEALAPTGEP